MHPFQGVLHGEHIQCDSVCSWTSQVPTRARPTSCGSGADAAAATHVASVPIHREAAPHSCDSLLISEALQDAPYVMTVWWATRQVPVRLRGRVSKIRIRVRIHVRVSARCVSIRYVPHRFVSLATDRPKDYFLEARRAQPACPHLHSGRLSSIGSRARRDSPTCRAVRWRSWRARELL